MKIQGLAIALFLAVFVAVGTASAQDIVVVNGVKYRVHDVVKGETLYSLSRQYGVTVDEIVAVNESLADGLKADTRIRIPMSSEVKGSEVKGSEVTQPSSPTPQESVAQVEPQPSPEMQPAVEPQHTAAASATPHNNDRGERHRRRQAMLENIKGIISNKSNANHSTKQSDSDTTSLSPVNSEVALASADSLSNDTAPHTPSLFRKLGKNDVAEVALMLPLGSEAKPSANYLDFYRGFLIGLDSVRMAGYSVNLSLLNTAHDHLRVDMIAAMDALTTANLVVGPIYEDELIPIASALRLMGTPIVSPLADLKQVTSDNIFQMSPSPESKYDKVKSCFDGSRRVVIISAEAVDTEFDAEVRALIQPGTQVVEHKYVYEHPSVIEKREKANVGKTIPPSPSDLTPLLRGKTPTIVAITAKNEVDVDRILAALAAARKSLVSRSISYTPFEVLGNNRWNRFTNIDRANLFATNVIMLSTYHARRSEPIIRAFDSRFVQEFGSIPTRYAYRGYDAAVLFVRALFENIDNGLEGEIFRPLLTPYRFATRGSGVRINSEWVKVMYHTNYTITND